jgi:hypothetical protein
MGLEQFTKEVKMNPADQLQMEKFFLRRLEKFANLACLQSTPPQLHRLARHATLSAYRDCATIGLEPVAREILGRTIGRTALGG